MLGCAALRDGAYLMPGIRPAADLERLAHELNVAGGSAEILNFDSADTAQAGRFQSLFDRSADYGRLLETVVGTQPDERALRVLRREFSAICAIDYFPGEAKRQAAATLAALAAAASGEPTARSAATLPRLYRDDYQNRV